MSPPDFFSTSSLNMTRFWPRWLFSGSWSEMRIVVNRQTGGDARKFHRKTSPRGALWTAPVVRSRARPKSRILAEACNTGPNPIVKIAE
jgi:hypothetical protein